MAPRGPGGQLDLGEGTADSATLLAKGTPEEMKLLDGLLKQASSIQGTLQHGMQNIGKGKPLAATETNSDQLVKKLRAQSASHQDEIAKLKRKLNDAEASTAKRIARMKGQAAKAVAEAQKAAKLNTDKVIAELQETLRDSNAENTKMHADQLARLKEKLKESQAAAEWKMAKMKGSAAAAVAAARAKAKMEADQLIAKLERQIKAKTAKMESNSASHQDEIAKLKRKLNKTEASTAKRIARMKGEAAKAVAEAHKAAKLNTDKVIAELQETLRDSNAENTKMHADQLARLKEKLKESQAAAEWKMAKMKGSAAAAVAAARAKAKMEADQLIAKLERQIKAKTAKMESNSASHQDEIAKLKRNLDAAQSDLAKTKAKLQAQKEQSIGKLMPIIAMLVAEEVSRAMNKFKGGKSAMTLAVEQSVRKRLELGDDVSAEPTFIQEDETKARKLDVEKPLPLSVTTIKMANDTANERCQKYNQSMSVADNMTMTDANVTSLLGTKAMWCHVVEYGKKCNITDAASDACVKLKHGCDFMATYQSAYLDLNQTTTVCTVRKVVLHAKRDSRDGKARKIHMKLRHSRQMLSHARRRSFRRGSFRRGSFRRGSFRRRSFRQSTVRGLSTFDQKRVGLFRDFKVAWDARHKHDGCTIECVESKECGSKVQCKGARETWRQEFKKIVAKKKIRQQQQVDDLLQLAGVMIV